MVAVHQQDGYLILLIKDYLGAVFQAYKARPDGSSWMNNWTYEPTDSYEPFGGASLTGSVKYGYQDKENQNNLYFFGARDYSSRTVQGGSSLRWCSPDPVTSNIYDPQSLNKYSYVRNDPVNKIDPDGRDWGVTENNRLVYQIETAAPKYLPFEMFYLVKIGIFEIWDIQMISSSWAWMNSWAPEPIYGPSGGGVIRPNGDAPMNLEQALNGGMWNRLDSQGGCKAFLNNLIDNLKKDHGHGGPLIAHHVDLTYLINAITSANPTQGTNLSSITQGNE